MFISQTTDFHFVSSHFVSFHFVSSHFVSQTTVSRLKAPLWLYIILYRARPRGIIVNIYIIPLSRTEEVRINSCHCDPSPTPTDSQESEVSRELTRGSPMDSCHGNPSPSDPMESVCRYFRPPPQLYFAEYVLSLSLLRTDMRRFDGFLPRQPVCIGSDGVRLPTFSTPSSAILCCIFIKSLAN